MASLKSFPSPEAVNTTTGPQLPKYVSAALGSLDQPWPARASSKTPAVQRSERGSNIWSSATKLRYLNRIGPSSIEEPGIEEAGRDAIVSMVD
jgi:hypothetical protein